MNCIFDESWGSSFPIEEHRANSPLIIVFLFCDWSTPDFIFTQEWVVENSSLAVCDHWLPLPVILLAEGVASRQ